MTAENPADTVTEQAAKVGAEAIYWTLEWEQLDDATRSDAIEFARALHDAGLLADPADRDRCHVVGCVEHIDGMHVDQVGDAIVHVGCPACRPLADPADRDALGRFAQSPHLEAKWHKRIREAELDEQAETYKRVKSEGVRALKRAERAEAEVAELREKWLTFTSALGFGNNRTEPAAELSEMIDPIEQAFSDAGDHQECAVICELCGEPLASKTCDECHGSGCLPNSRLAYLECGTCAGVGKIHEGCVEKSYTDLVAERDAEYRKYAQEADRAETLEAENAELRATVARVRGLADRWERWGHDGVPIRPSTAGGYLRAALDGAGEQQ